MSFSGGKRSAEAEDLISSVNKRRALSGISSESEFKQAYAGYSFDNSTRLIEPKCFDEAGLELLVRSVAPSLVGCSCATKIDSEASRYPFVYELIKFLVRINGSGYQIHAHGKHHEPSENETRELASIFVRDSETEQEEESLEELIMRWERYFPTAGRDTFGYGYVEFTVESAIDKMVKYLIEVKKNLDRNSVNITECNGFWQAVAEAAAARVANIEKAGSIAYDEGMAKKREEGRPAPINKTKKEADRVEKTWTEAIRQAGALARSEAEIEAAKIPVWVTLTDFNEWVFLKLDGKTIKASEALRIFNFSGEQLTAYPTTLNALQFFCEAIGVKGSTEELQARIHAVRASDEKQTERFVDSIYSEKITAVCLGMSMSPMTGAQAKEKLRELFPLVDADKYIDW